MQIDKSTVYKSDSADVTIIHTPNSATFTVGHADLPFHEFINKLHELTGEIQKHLTSPNNTFTSKKPQEVIRSANIKPKTTSTPTIPKVSTQKIKEVPEKPDQDIDDFLTAKFDQATKKTQADIDAEQQQVAKKQITTPDGRVLFVDVNVGGGDTAATPQKRDDSIRIGGFNPQKAKDDAKGLKS